MRYLAWRSRAGTAGGGGDDLASARLACQDVPASMARELRAWELRAGEVPAQGRPEGLGQAGRHGTGWQAWDRLAGLGPAGKNRRGEGRAEAA